MKRSGNIQGDYRFLSLKTGRVLTRHHFTKVPINSQVIARVEQLALQEGVLTDEEEFLHGNNSPVEDAVESKEEQDTKEDVLISNEPHPELIVDKTEEEETPVGTGGEMPTGSPPVIDLTIEEPKKFQSLPAEPTAVKEEEENEIVFEATGSTEAEGLFERPFMRKQNEGGNYVTRSRRTTKPVTTYVPTVGSEKKYPEVVGVMETMEHPKKPQEGADWKDEEGPK